jgi:hypothetical protein
MALILEPAQTSEAAPPQTSQPQQPAAPAPSTQAAASEQPKEQPQEQPASPAAASPEAEQPETEQAKAEAARAAYALRQQERALKKRQDDLQAREAALKEAAAKREAEEAEYAQLDELALLERISAKTGKSLDSIVRGAIARVANGGEPSPEQKMAALEKLAREALERADKMEASMRERDEAAQRARAEADAQNRIEQMRLSIAASIDPEAHPFLNTYGADEVAEHALMLANEYAVRTGEAPEFADVLEYMEAQESAEFERRATAAGWTKQQIRDASPAAKDEPAPPPMRDVSSGGLVYGDASLEAAQRAAGVSQGVVRNNRGQFQRSGAAVTNGQASARGEAPVNWSAMSERERITRAAAEVFGKKG